MPPESLVVLVGGQFATSLGAQPGYMGAPSSAGLFRPDRIGEGAGIWCDGRICETEGASESRLLRSARPFARPRAALRP